MRFSQRKGLNPVRIDIQRDGIDAPLRNRLWSGLCVIVFEASESAWRFKYGGDPDVISTQLWLHFFDRPIDEKPRDGLSGLKENIRNWFMKTEWYEVYDFVQAVAELLTEAHLAVFAELMNSFLEQDLSAYRIVGSQVADITSQEEIEAIEAALRDAGPLVGVRTHIEAALELLSDKKSPDFRNSVKEAICAVESMCQAITHDTSATLGKALKKLKDHGIVLHPAVETAWLKLYGFTSDAGGIRHALSDKSAVTRADARYMLVSCSAFVSYLTEQASAASVVLQQTK